MSTFYDKIFSLEDAMVVRPATTEDIEDANKELAGFGLPPIPSGYAGFLQRCNGFAFNGVEFFGTDIVTDPETGFQLIDIVTFTQEQLDYFEEGLLYFGRVDDDIFTFNPDTGKYEARDISGFEVWEAYDTFEAFLEKEIGAKYLPDEEAEYLSALIYEKMKENPAFMKNVLQYYTLMAEAGNAEAQYRLAMLLLFDDGVVEQDYDIAINWLAKAAGQGHRQAEQVYLEEIIPDDDGRYDAWA